MRRMLLAVIVTLSVVAGVLCLLPGSRSLSMGKCGRLTSRSAREACVESVLVSQGRSGGFGSAAALLGESLAADPGLWDVCHDSAHAAAAAVDVSEREVEDLLGSGSVDACAWGMFHGALAGLSSSGLPADRFEEMLGRWCAGADRGFVLGCADSLGHALYDADGEFVSAAGRCRAARTPDAVAFCVGGVFMQRYEPVGSTGEELLSWDEIPSLCARLDAAGLAGACGQAAHYAAARPLRLLVRSAPSPDASPAAMSEFFTARVPDALTAGQGLCARFAAGAERCEEELLAYAVQALRALPAALVDDLVCDRASTPAALRHCADALASLAS